MIILTTITTILGFPGIRFPFDGGNGGDGGGNKNPPRKVEPPRENPLPPRDEPICEAARYAEVQDTGADTLTDSNDLSLVSADIKNLYNNQSVLTKLFTWSNKSMSITMAFSKTSNTFTDDYELITLPTEIKSVGSVVFTDDSILYYYSTRIIAGAYVVFTGYIKGQEPIETTYVTTSIDGIVKIAPIKNESYVIATMITEYDLYLRNVLLNSTDTIFNITKTMCNPITSYEINSAIDGTFTLVWSHLNHLGIYSQRYFSNGSLIGAEIRIDSNPQYFFTDTTVNGSYVIGWQERNCDLSSDVFKSYAQIFTNTSQMSSVLATLNTDSWTFLDGIQLVTDYGYVAYLINYHNFTYVQRIFGADGTMLLNNITSLENSINLNNPTITPQGREANVLGCFDDTQDDDEELQQINENSQTQDSNTNNVRLRSCNPCSRTTRYLLFGGAIFLTFGGLGVLAYIISKEESDLTQQPKKKTQTSVLTKTMTFKDTDSKSSEESKSYSPDLTDSHTSTQDTSLSRSMSKSITNSESNSNSDSTSTSSTSTESQSLTLSLSLSNSHSQSASILCYPSLGGTCIYSSGAGGQENAQARLNIVTNSITCLANSFQQIQPYLSSNGNIALLNTKQTQLYKDNICSNTSDVIFSQKFDTQVVHKLDLNLDYEVGIYQYYNCNIESSCHKNFQDRLSLLSPSGTLNYQVVNSLYIQALESINDNFTNNKNLIDKIIDEIDVVFSNSDSRDVKALKSSIGTFGYVNHKANCVEKPQFVICPLAFTDQIELTNTLVHELSHVAYKSVDCRSGRALPPQCNGIVVDYNKNVCKVNLCGDIILDDATCIEDFFVGVC